ncbi:MAG: 4Fe-4S binding protein [Dehalococcoidia bacterium]|nr:4Fe-4S binding protein [Dehalococcoidia bacterium]MDD5494364.1 4Fe-4S binding protein [Dehalococcoidia bacterium]
MEQAKTKIKRKVVKIDEEKCDGCGLCVLSCAEGALKIIDGKARIISDKYCDSLGACLPGCPQGAISIEEREAEPFDEEAVKEHLNKEEKAEQEPLCGCPGSAVKELKSKYTLPCGCPASTVSQFNEVKLGDPVPATADIPSQLGHWPVQLTLVPPRAPFLQQADVLLAADCTAFSYGGFHRDFLKHHALLVACPKLDNYDEHLGRLTDILRQSDIRSLTVLRMEVPCCAGLTRMAMQAILSSGKDIPFKEIIIGIRGDIKN